MTTWPRVTENLILQNSNMVVEHGGHIGATDWSYGPDDVGVMTIDADMGFYLNPPPDARCRWSTNFGHNAPQQIVLHPANGYAMPARRFVQWDKDTQMRKFNEYRQLHWEDLKNLVRPNNFEDLFDLFDASTLWANGAYNMWLLVNMLVTHAHNEFPAMLQEWKVYVDSVINDFFRVIPGSRQGVSHVDKMQLSHNQSVLSNWDEKTDPLLLLQHTNFPVDELRFMNIQQHGLFRDSLVSEHARLTGKKPAFVAPSMYAHSADTQAAPAPNAVQVGPPATTAVKSPRRDPVIAVGSIEPESATVATRASPSSLDSIPEESAATKIVVSDVSETTNRCQSPSTKALSIQAKPFVPGQVMTDLAPEAESTPTEPKTAVAAEQAEVEVTASNADSADDEMTPTGEVRPIPVEATIPDIVTREATPTPDSPIRDRKDSNGSTDKLFFPDAPSDKLHVARQASVTSAPDFACTPMLTVAEKNDAQSSSMTPLVVQVNHDQHQLPPRPNFAVANPTGHADQGPHQFPVAGRNQGRQHSGPMGGPLPPMPYQGPYIEPPARHTSLMLPPHGPPNAFNSFAPHGQPGPNGFVPHSGPPAAPGMHLPMGPHVGPQSGPHAGPHAGPHMAPHAMTPMGAPFQGQVPPHLNQQHFGPHGPQGQMNVSPPFMGPPGQGVHTEHQPNGYDQQYQHQASHGNYGDKGNGYRNNGYKGNNGYASNGYRNNGYNRNTGNQNYQRNGKFSDNNQANGPLRPRGNSNSSAVNGQPRQMSGNGKSARRSSTASKSGQNIGRNDWQVACNNHALREISVKRGQITPDTLYEDCRCRLCQLATRSVQIVLALPGGDDMSIQGDLYRHFTIFKPVRVNLTKDWCFIEFENDYEASSAVQWVRFTHNNWPSCAQQVWYPRFSKHYTPAYSNPQGLTRKEFEEKQLSHTNSVGAPTRRQSNPFVGQQPIEAASTYGGPMQDYFQNAAFNGQLPAQNFVPAAGMVSQQVPAQMPPRGLFDPYALQSGDSRVETRTMPQTKTKQQSGQKSTSSKEPAARVNKIMSHDTWRPAQRKSPSKEATVDEENDTGDTLKDTASSHSSAKMSVPSEQGSACDSSACAISRSLTPEVVGKMEGMTGQTESQVKSTQPQGPKMDQAFKQQSEKQLPQKQLSQKAQSKSKSRPHKNKSYQDILPGKSQQGKSQQGKSQQDKSQQDKSHQQHVAAVDSKLSDKSSEQAVTSSQTPAVQDPKTAQQSQPSTVPVVATESVVDEKPQSAATPSSMTSDAKKDVQHDDKCDSKNTESAVADSDNEKPTTSSLALAPGATKPVQQEIMTHRKRTTTKNNTDAGWNKNTGKSKSADLTKKDHQKKGADPKQSGYRKTAADLTVSVERLEDQTAKTQTGPEIFSAVEVVNYPTDTVIRHKTNRPTLPTDWADDVNERPSTRTPSPSDDMLPESSVASVAKRLSEIGRDLEPATAVNITMFSSIDEAIAFSILPASDEASASNDAPAPEEDRIDHKDPSVATQSTTQAEQEQERTAKPKKKKNNKSRKAHGATSQLTSRSNTPTLTDTQSRGPSPAFNKPSSSAAPSKASSRAPSPAMQNHSRTKPQKNNRKRKLTLREPETSEELAKSSGSQDNKEQGAPMGSSTQDNQTLQAKPSQADVPTAVEVANESQPKPSNAAGKSSNGNFRANAAGNSLRISKARSPKKWSQDHGRQGNTDTQSTTSAAASLVAIFEPPTKTGSDAPAPVVQKNSTIDKTKGMPASQAGTSESTKKEEDVALASSPFPTSAPNTKPRGNWAAVAKNGAAQFTSAENKKENDDPFAPGKDEASLSDFIKTKNVKSPQKQDFSHDQPSPTPSPEKKNARISKQGKSQLNASVQTFNPSTAAPSKSKAGKQKLNPAAAAFTSFSPAGSVTLNAAAPARGSSENKKTNDQPVPSGERGPAKKGHAHKPSLPGQAKALDKRFITPAEQIIDPSKVMQPPAPNRRLVPIPERSNKSAVPIADRSNTNAEASKTPEPTPASTISVEPTDDAQGKDVVKTVPTELSIASPKTVGDAPLNAELPTAPNGGFPTLNQAAATAPTRKRRAASVLKAGLPAVVPTAPASGTLVGKHINNASTQKNGPKQAQGGAKARPDPVQSSVTAAPSSASTKADQPKVERAETPEVGQKQNGDDDDWQMVGGKQNHTGGGAGGANRGRGGWRNGRGRGGRWGKGGGHRGGRGGQGVQDGGAAEDRKGG